jgi:hypothetical protein
MKVFNSVWFISAVLMHSCNVNKRSSYYTGDHRQDSIIRVIDNKYKNLKPIKLTKGKRFFGSDSIVYYTVNKLTNQLQSVGFTELKTDSRTTYDLINGKLIKVRYVPNNRERSASTIYFYDDGNFILKRERNDISPEPGKFLDDLEFFRSALGVK